ncbi:MAG: phospholipase D-like domain-containing protein [Nitrososphaerales archaeon]
MTRRLIVALFAFLLGCSLLGSAAAPDASAHEVLPYRVHLPIITGRGAIPSVSPPLISGLLYDGIVTGEADEAFQLYNPNDFGVDLEGWQVQSGSRRVAFPAGLSLAAQSSLWCGREAVSFRRSFGRLPDCEWGVDTDRSVLNLQGGALSLPNSGGALILRRPDGGASDVLVYKAGNAPAEGGWDGPSVVPYTPSPAFHEQGQILYRKLDERNGLPADTGAATDWASDPLDVLAGRRVRYPGWSLERFLQPAVAEEFAALQLLVAPDHAFDALAARLAAASATVMFEGYTFESAPLGLLLADRARAGVQVTILLEGAPPGGVSDQQRWVVQQLSQAGARIYYMRSNSRAGIHDRYTNQHAKMWLIDNRLALVGSENPSPDSFPDDDKSDGTVGRRGVYIATDAAGVLARVRDIMAADIDPASADIWPYDPTDEDLGAPPPEFVPILSSGGNEYKLRIPQPLSLQGRFHFEFCQAPEHALRTSDCFLGLANRAGAGDTLLIEQLDEPAYWGPADGSVESDPNPRLQAYLDAARRGARVRILLDSFFDDLSTSRSNLRTEEYLAAASRAEGLDLQVRRGNPTGLGLHNKMVLAEVGGQGWAMVGSLNGGEASAKLNREVSLVLQSDEAYRYLAEMFWGDWGQH